MSKSNWYNQFMRYNHLNEYLKNKFGERTLKICVDGNFTCPNRDGTKGVGGCIFCGERGSGERIKNIGLKEQVLNHLNSYRGQRANKFIIYFQNFTNTYGSIENLKEKYESALIDKRIVALDIDTRPDCINEDVCKMLCCFKDKYYVYVELGLQTINEKTHEFINQKITNKDFENAILLLNKYNIDVVVHVMIGLPNETHQDVINLVQYLNNFKYKGIKIHSTYVQKNTILEKMYLNGEYKPIDMQEYVDEVIYIISHINKDVIIHRITGDPPKDLLVAPNWMVHKKMVLNSIEKKLEVENLTQGCKIKENIL